MDAKNKPITEIRFAVVLYGGISLAIYINGIVQELYKMVRATAAEDASDLKGSEKIYHEIGRELGVKFVVDVLSGSSAGGINAIYLAKALVNQQPLDGIEMTWVSEGDIGKLINDTKSNEGLPKDLMAKLNRSPRKSLLNGQRMYFKLLETLHIMDEPPSNNVANKTKNPYVHELDLFITATDLNGLINPIRLSNNVVYEDRHRSVFHFRYADRKHTGEERNDFLQPDNPYLAFAARCTSSLPFVFEPVTLISIREVLKHHTDFNFYEAQYEKHLKTKWINYFADYAKRETLDVFQNRPFADGGYLDNKPFSFATNTLLQRHASRPVDRKLIYVEPAPEKPGSIKDKDVPDGLENLVLALSSLPRKEPIVDDIQAVKERNQIIERIRNYQQFAIEGLKHIERLKQNKHQIKGGKQPEPQEQQIQAQLTTWFPKIDPNWKEDKQRPPQGKSWSDMNLTESIQKYGLSYYNYHHIRVSLVTDNLARLVAHAMGFDDESDSFAAIRLLTRTWREQKFKRDPDNKKTKSENYFMSRMDIGFRIRRLRFLLNLINTLDILPGKFLSTNDEKAKQVRDIFEFWKDEKIPPNTDFTAYTGISGESYSKELNQLRTEINNILYKLLFYNREIHPQSAKGQNELISFESKKESEKVKEYNNQIETSLRKINFPELDDIAIKAILRSSLQPEQPTPIHKKEPSTYEAIASYLPADSNAEKSDADKKTFLENLKALEGNLNTIEGMVHAVLRGTKEECKDFFAKGDVLFIRHCLQFYFYNYHYFDVMAVPMTAGTTAAEADIIDIIRISPEDATSEINKGLDKQKKLRGTHYGNFGGFFSPDWRKADILWGRLDAADIVINSLIGYPANNPEKRVRIEKEEKIKTWVKEAQAAILRERLFDTNDAIIKESLPDFHRQASGAVLGEINKIINPDKEIQMIDDERIKTIVMESLETENLLKLFNKMQKEKSELSPEETAINASRAVRVIGQVLEGLSDKYTAIASPAAWITRLAQITSGIVEMALPGRLPHILSRHLFKLLYLAEFVVIVVGYLTSNPAIVESGWYAVLFTAGIHLAVLTFLQVVKLKPLWLLPIYAFEVFIVGLGVYFKSQVRFEEILLGLSKYITWPSLIYGGLIAIGLTILAQLIVWSRPNPYPQKKKDYGQNDEQSKQEPGSARKTNVKA